MSHKSKAGKFFVIGLLIMAIIGFFGFRAYYDSRHRIPVYPKAEVTIPEGYTVSQIDSLLFKEGVIETEGAILALKPANFEENYPFLKGQLSLEGFLYPDTYEFFLGSNPEIVLRKFLDQFDAKLWRPYLKDYKGNIWYDRLILASVVEREVPDRGEERALVAGLYLNRMEIDMALQADITICYVPGLCNKDGVTPKNLQVKSPYNTYLNKGLPPTPIGNPSLSAVLGAIYPKESSYLFYISDPTTKKTIFARTIDEHNENIVKYLR